MDTLVLVRHAKSDWSVPADDRDRPLAARGRRQAPLSGAWLAAHGPRPDLVLVSPALRARDTWALVAGEHADPPAHVVDERLYTFDVDDLAAVVDDPFVGRHACVLLVGHDPGITDLLHRFTGAGLAMPTSAVAVVDVADGVLRAHGRPPDGAMRPR